MKRAVQYWTEKGSSAGNRNGKLEGVGFRFALRRYFHGGDDVSIEVDFSPHPTVPPVEYLEQFCSELEQEIAEFRKIVKLAVEDKGAA